MGDDGTPERRDTPADRPAHRDGSDRPPAGLDHPVQARPRPLRHHAAGAGVLALVAATAVATAFVGAGPALADRAVLGEAIQLRSGPVTWIVVAITYAGS